MLMTPPVCLGRWRAAGAPTWMRTRPSSRTRTPVRSDPVPFSLQLLQNLSVVKIPAGRTAPGSGFRLPIRAGSDPVRLGLM